MIPAAKLLRVPGRARLRKAVLILTEIEARFMAGHHDPGDFAYLQSIALVLAGTAELPETFREMARELAVASGSPAEKTPSVLLRDLDALRHRLIQITGQSPADWDLIDPNTGKADSASRDILPGMRVYCEDIRSPFNLGSMFRTADAFGVDELILSPDCASEDHPRALRSAMGAIAAVQHRRAGLEILDECGPAFALELGGVPLGDFDFPERGIVVLGSEELGVSPEALSRCGLGKVSIPMSGIKGSLNVAVAFGVLLHAWRTKRRGSASNPV